MADNKVVKRGYEYTISIKNASEGIKDIKALAEGLSDVRKQGKDVVLSFTMQDFQKNFDKINTFMSKLREAGHNMTLIDVDGFKKQIAENEKELINLKNVFSNKGDYKDKVRSVDELFPGLDSKELKRKRAELLKEMEGLYGDSGQGKWKSDVESAKRLLSVVEQIYSITNKLGDNRLNLVKGEIAGGKGMNAASEVCWESGQRTERC